MSNNVLTITDLTRRFGRTIANDRVSLRVREREIVGLLGHNGAGKTTLVSQIVGLLRPHAGSIEVAGINAVARPAVARRLVAVQPQAQAPVNGLTPRRAIEIAARLRGLSRRDSRAAAASVVDELDIGPWVDRRALPDGGGLSGGVRRLVAFAMAVVAPVPLVVLDEPTNDIDAARRRLLWDAVRRRGDEGAGVLVVTHNVVEAERVVDAVIVLDRGRVAVSGTPTELRGRDDLLRLELQRVPDARGDEPRAAPADVSVLRRATVGRRELLSIPQDAAPAAVEWAAALRDAGRIEQFSLSPSTLEDAYLALTGDGASGHDEREAVLASGEAPSASLNVEGAATNV